MVLGTSLKNKHVEWIRLDQVNCNSNIFCFLFMCLPESRKSFLNYDHLPLDVTFVIGAWCHHMTKGRWLVIVLPILLEVFLVWLALQLELFMSFLSPRLHPFFLILLSCHLSALRFFNTLLDLFSHSLFYACKGLVDNTYPKEYTILKHGLFV